jgi:hypothetical protein
MFAIMKKKTGEFVYGTDYRYSPPRQKVNKDQMITYDEKIYADADFLNRRCSKASYKVVKISVKIEDDNI